MSSLSVLDPRSGQYDTPMLPHKTDRKPQNLSRIARPHLNVSMGLMQVSWGRFRWITLKGETNGQIDMVCGGE